MTEILQMTTQAQPLKVGVPLYPFSHASVFNRGEDGKSPDMEGVAAGGHVAPLPSPGYEQEDTPVTAGAQGVGGMWNGATLNPTASASPSYSQGGY